MYCMLVLALAAAAYAATPDYLKAYSNNLKARKLLTERLNLTNSEGLNHLMLAVAIRELADAVTGKHYLYAYIYKSTVEAAIKNVLKNPTEEARYLEYRRIQAHGKIVKVQTFVEELCLPKRLGAVRCNELVDEAVKRNNLQQSGRLQIALGDAGYGYLSILPKLDEVAKNQLANNYLTGEGRGGLVDLVIKVAAVNENL